MRYARVARRQRQSSLEQAILADSAGWDGVFAWEAAYGVDRWTLLASIAQRTTRIRLGARTPSPGVSVEIGQPGGRARSAFGRPGDSRPSSGLDRRGAGRDAAKRRTRRIRAERLDEGIDLIAGLWQDNLLQRTSLRDRPGRNRRFSRRPNPPRRIPIWVVGAWPRTKSMQRVLRCDGLLAAAMTQTASRA